MGYDRNIITTVVTFSTAQTTTAIIGVGRFANTTTTTTTTTTGRFRRFFFLFRFVVVRGRI